MNVDHRKEILFYYESVGANPNGDPGFEDQPRLMSDQTILVTDLRLKRTAREYAKNHLDQTLFVDYNKAGVPVIAFDKAIEVLGVNGKKLPKDTIKQLLEKTWDSNLFGLFLPVPEKKRTKKEIAWYNLTGSVQFGLGRSVNKVELIHPTISAHFVGKPSDAGVDYSTLGSFWAVEYALIKFEGGINPNNLGMFNENGETPPSFDDAEGKLFESIWDGTNNLHSRSKFMQRSVFYFEVTYKKKTYNDLPVLIDDSKMEGKQTKLVDNAFDTDNLEKALIKRKDDIVKIRMRGFELLEDQVDGLCSNLKAGGLDAEIV